MIKKPQRKSQSYNLDVNEVSVKAQQEGKDRVSKKRVNFKVMWRCSKQKNSHASAHKILLNIGLLTLTVLLWVSRSGFPI